MDPRNSRSARLQRSIDELMKQTPEIQGALIVSTDGFLVAAAVDNADTIGPIAANLFDLSVKATQRLDQGDPQRVIVDACEGTLAVVPAGPHALVVAVVRKQVKLGIVLELMTRSAKVVADLME